MPDLPRTPSLTALRELFFASAKAEQAAHQQRYRGSPEQLRLLKAVNAVHPCDQLAADIEVLQDTLAAARTSLPFTTPE